MSMLPALTGVTMFTRWRVNWLTVAVAAVAMSWYLIRWHRLVATGAYWPARRITALAFGAVVYLWCTNGFLNAYAATLLWVWSIQVLALLLVIPVLLMAAQPVELATRTARHPVAAGTGCVGHLISRIIRSFTHPFVAPALVPVVTTILFFGHVAGIWTSNPAVGALLGVVLLGVGCLLAAGLTIEDRAAASLAVGLALAVSVLELLTDAIPGIVLRLDTHLVTHHFAVIHASWAMSPLADQKLAGSILWGVAELLDIPFLFVMFLRWIRADEREARRIDHVPGPQPASAHVSTEPGSPAPSAATDEPWWLHDPELSHRLGLTESQPRDRRINPEAPAVRSWRRPAHPPGRAADQASASIDDTSGTVRVRLRDVLVAALIVAVSATSIAVAVTSLSHGTSTAVGRLVPGVVRPHEVAAPAAIAPSPVPLGSSGAGLPSTAPTALFVGASYTAGLGAQPATDGYAYDTARLLGWRAEIDGASGTGYLNPGHHGAGTYPGRISRVSLPFAPAVIVIQSGRNDLGSPLTAIHQAVLNTLSLTRHRWPHARLVVLGAIPATVPVPPGLIGLEGVLRGACATAGVAFIDPIAQNWITASNERDNAGLVPAHPGNTGYAYLASRLAADLTGLLPSALIHVQGTP